MLVSGEAGLEQNFTRKFQL